MMIQSTEDSPALLDRIMHAHWVGRVLEMAEAHALWQRVVQGEGRVLLIRGEPGVGKTRFVHELASSVRLDGASVLAGECYAEASPPYSPLAQMVRYIFGGSPQTVKEMPQETLQNLLSILSSLNSQFVEGLSDRKVELQAERQQVIEGFVAFCSTLSSRVPLFLFIDDVHWADADTLFLLRALARRVRKLPVLIVMTYREAELESATVLKKVLVDLNHERLSLQLKLDRLTRAETGDLLAAMFGEEITPEFLDGIFDQTEGNPFFMEEVCKALVDAGQLSFRDGRWHRPAMAEMKIPQTVRAAIQARLQKLPKITQDVLRMAAILGRDFDFETLQHACDLDEDALIEALESAVRAQLIAEVRPGQAAKFNFNFVHVLIPTTLRESIIHVRRRRLHLRVAQAIEVVHPDDFELLAYHYIKAGEVERARQFYMRAGDRAQRPAPGEAARFYQSALELWPENDEFGKAEALAGLGYCLWTTDHVQDALRIYEAAYNLFQKLGDRTRSGEMQWMIGQIYWEQTNQEASLRHYHQALTILEEGPETPELARAISEISRMYMLVNEYAEAEAWGERALEMAKRLGAEDVMAHAMINIGSSYGGRGDFDASLKMFQSALQKALASGLPPAACRAYDNWADALSSCCRYAQGKEVSEQLYIYATKVHAQNFILKGILRLTDLDWLMGHWDSALSYRAQMIKSGISIMSLYISLNLGRMDNDLGRPEDARAELEETLLNAVQAGQPDIRIFHLGELARAYALLGQEAKNADVLQQLIELVTHDPRLLAMEIMPICFASRWYASQSATNSQERYQLCLAHLERLNAQFQTGESKAALAEARGSWLAAEKRSQEAAGHFRQAAAHWQSITRPYDQARALASLGGALKSMEDMTAAMEAYNQAANIYDSLAKQLDPDLRTTFLNSHPVRDVHRAVEALACIPLQKETRQEPSLLTEREIEVLKLVAQGLTNAQIAEQLVLSPLTVNAHLRSIFNKLDVSNRTAAVHQAGELGLV